MKKDFIVLDTETTGLTPGECQITEIGAIKVNGETLEIIDTYETLVKIKGPVSKFITNLTGITKKMLKKDGIKITKALEKLSEFSGDLDVYAHYSPFDKKFIRYFLAETKTEFIESQWIDTIKIFREKFPGRRSYKLDGLIKDYGLADKEDHRALSDAMHTLTLLKMGEGYVVDKFETQESLINDVFVEMKKVIDVKISDENFTREPIMGTSLTMILKDRKTGLNVEFLTSNLKYNKTKIIRGRTPKSEITPMYFTGTAMDQMVEYYFDREKYIERITNDIKVPDKVIKSITGVKELDVYDFLAISFGISYFRGGEEHDKEIYELAVEKKSDEWHVKQLKPYLAIAKEESSRLANKTIFNPVFGSVNSGIKADGDFIFGNKLCEMKTSKRPSFNRDYKLQLISYILLNKLLDKPYDISDKEVLYWNPYFGIFEEFEIVINDEIERNFKIALDRYNVLYSNERLFNIFRYTISLMGMISANIWENPEFKLPDKEIGKLKIMKQKLQNFK